MIAIKNRRPSCDHRSLEDIEHHYRVEKELAGRLRDAERTQRLHLYSELYDECFERVPNIPGWNDQLPAEILHRNLANKLKFLKRFISSESTFLELGAGDCSLSLTVADHVEKVFAVDVSKAITNDVDPPSNFELLISDGVSIDLPDQSVDVAYSSNLMEHLHPDDAIEQLTHVMRVLKPGGFYICITPSKLSGPHDVSKYFDETPTCFHLKEYSTTEMARIFRGVGFERIKPYVWMKERLIVMPLWVVVGVEKVLGMIPRSLCRYICNRFPTNHVVGRVIAQAPTKA